MKTLKRKSLKLRRGREVDPTRTATIRKGFKRDIRARFDLFKRQIREYLLSDTLRLEPIQGIAPVGNAIFGSIRSRIEQFGGWVREKATQLFEKTIDRLVEEFVDRVYKRGIDRAYEDVKSPAPVVPASKADFEKAIQNVPAVRPAKEQVATRIEIGIGDAITRIIERSKLKIIDGVERGDTPREISDAVVVEIDKGNESVDGIIDDNGVRGHADGQLFGFEWLGVQQVGVAVEWRTAGDGRVCKLCAAMSGVVLRVSEAKGLIPRHPKCRCAWVPAKWVPPVKTTVTGNAAKKPSAGSGRWVTMQGRHVYIQGGKVLSGPGGKVLDTKSLYKGGKADKDSKTPSKPSSKEPDKPPAAPNKPSLKKPSEASAPDKKPVEKKAAPEQKKPSTKKESEAAAPAKSAEKATKYKSGAEAEKALTSSTKQWSDPHDDYFGNKAIKQYAGTSDSFLINDHLRGNRPKDKHLKAKADELAKVIDKASLPHAVEVRRAINPKTAEERASILKSFQDNLGKTFTDPAFTSTTANHQYAEAWIKKMGSATEPIRVTVNVPKGAKAVYLPETLVGKKEWEVLLQKGSKFKVAKIENGHVTLEMQ